jgi:hypothetical protein
MQDWRSLNSGDDRIEIHDTLAEARERFGENYQGFVFTLTRAQAEALLQGKVVAFDIGGREYAGFMLVQEPLAHEQSPARFSPDNERHRWRMVAPAGCAVAVSVSSNARLVFRCNVHYDPSIPLVPRAVGRYFKCLPPIGD